MKGMNTNMERWFIERLGLLRTSHESLRHGVHWATFEALPEDWTCRSCVQALHDGRARHELDMQAGVCRLFNRGRPLAVFRGEPVPGTNGRHAFAETRLVETGESVTVRIRTMRCFPRHGKVAEVAEDLLCECLPAATDCGLVVIVRGLLVRLEWFGHPRLFRARARELLRQSAVTGLAIGRLWGSWVPGDALAALGRMKWGEKRAMGRAWFRPLYFDEFWGSLVGWQDSLLHLRLARPDVFEHSDSVTGRRKRRRRGNRHAAS